MSKTKSSAPVVAAEPNFDELVKALHELDADTETLAKGGAAAADDKAVAGAAGEDANPEDDKPDGDEDGEDAGTMTKGGDMVDATDLIKSMLSRMDRGDDVLAKALTGFTSIMSKQNDLIKSLQSEVKALSTQGRGRKTMLTIAEKPPIGDLAKSGAAGDDGGITPAQLMAKSAAAYAAGKLSGTEHNTIDVCLRNGWSIDPGVLQKALAA